MMEDEFEADKQTLDERYEIKMASFNIFAQTFTLGCWLIKDSCVSTNKMHWENWINTYNMRARRDVDATLSDGSIDAIHLTDSEVQEVLTRTFEVLCYLGYRGLWKRCKTGVCCCFFFLARWIRDRIAIDVRHTISDDTNIV